MHSSSDSIIVSCHIVLNSLVFCSTVSDDRCNGNNNIHCSTLVISDDVYRSAAESYTQRLIDVHKNNIPLATVCIALYL